MHPALVEAEVMVVGKEAHGLLVVGVARHDEPVQGLAVAPPGRLNFLREHLEE